MTKLGGGHKFRLLVKVVHSGLLLSHENNDAKHGFSCTNLMVTKQRANLAGDSISYLQIMLDFMVSYCIYLLQDRNAYAKYKDCERKRVDD